VFAAGVGGTGVRGAGVGGIGVGGIGVGGIGVGGTGVVGTGVGGAGKHVNLASLVIGIGERQVIGEEQKQLKYLGTAVAERMVRPDPSDISIILVSYKWESYNHTGSGRMHTRM
jgi:hypothetical protein